jgi:hypothetical protein
LLPGPIALLRQSWDEWQGWRRYWGLNNDTEFQISTVTFYTESNAKCTRSHYDQVSICTMCNSYGHSYFSHAFTLPAPLLSMLACDPASDKHVKRVRQYKAERRGESDRRSACGEDTSRRELPAWCSCMNRYSVSVKLPAVEGPAQVRSSSNGCRGEVLRQLQSRLRLVLNPRFSIVMARQMRPLVTGGSAG